MSGRSGSYKRYKKKFIESVLKNEGKLCCKYCSIKLITGIHPPPDNGLTVDHVVPTSKGGKLYDDKNLVICCHKCNSLKGDSIWI